MMMMIMLSSSLQPLCVVAVGAVWCSVQCTCLSHHNILRSLSL